MAAGSPAFAQSAPANQPPQTAATWSYEGMSDGQDSWGMLSADYALCEIGTQQSPILISYTEKADLPALAFDYKEGAAELFFEDHVVKIRFSDTNMLRIGGLSYRLDHIAFHAPSEHMVRENFFPMEIHFVHRDFSGGQLNLALFVNSGQELQAFNAIASLMPVKADAVKKIGFNPASLLPGSLGYYSYTGSITHPPCTEGVEWRILKTPLQLSGKQMNTVINAMGRSARLEQPVYSRTILETRY